MNWLEISIITLTKNNRTQKSLDDEMRALFALLLIITMTILTAEVNHILNMLSTTMQAGGNIVPIVAFVIVIFIPFTIIGFYAGWFLTGMYQEGIRKIAASLSRVVSAIIARLLLWIIIASILN